MYSKSESCCNPSHSAASKSSKSTTLDTEIVSHILRTAIDRVLRYAFDNCGSFTVDKVHYVYSVWYASQMVSLEWAILITPLGGAHTKRALYAFIYEIRLKKISTIILAG